MHISVRHLILSILVFLFFIPFGAAFGRDSHGGSYPVVATIHKRLPADQDSAGGDSDIGGSMDRDSDIGERLPERSHIAGLNRFQKISARSGVIMDGASGRLLYARSPDLPLQPASTIKVLTGLLAMEALEDGTEVAVSRRAAGMPRSKIYLDQRKAYPADDLINAVLLASANDASVALAEWVAGSEREFATLMTRKAQQLGARNTICRTASGLTVRGQYSTARDLAIIFWQAMQNKEFASRVGQLEAKTKEGATLHNHNKALWSIAGAEGGKTGYTRAARQTYVGQFKRGDDTILVAIMGSETMWKDIRRLVDYGFTKKHQQRLTAKEEKSADPIITMDSPLSGVAEPPERIDLPTLADTKKLAKL
jgi:D-alanyl-D-alanine carboxypeptidase (penicillin-binding protein 5/6)